MTLESLSVSLIRTCQQVGITKLLADGVFTAAYPLHDGQIDAQDEDDASARKVPQVTIHSHYSLVTYTTRERENDQNLSR